MGSRRPFSEDAIRTLKAVMARTNDKTEYQRALCAIFDRHGWSRDAVVVTPQYTSASRVKWNPEAVPRDV